MISVPEEPATEAIVLGAGFSKALSDALPLLDPLGDAAVERAGVANDPRVPPDGFGGGTFERWLSRIAEDQPYLNEVENLENRLLFTKVTRGIHEVLAGGQALALASETPDWFYELLSVMHVRRTTVVTLNYDTLVECGVETYPLWDWKSGAEVRGEDLTRDLPHNASAPSGSHYRLTDTLRLLKLHGSLNWYWSPGDSSGATFQSWEIPGRFGAPAQLDDDERRRVLPGRESFIVPPSATKSGYYGNAVTRELWAQAFKALRAAHRVVLMGYSLPLG